MHICDYCHIFLVHHFLEQHEVFKSKKFAQQCLQCTTDMCVTPVGNLIAGGVARGMDRPTAGHAHPHSDTGKA